MATPYPWRSGRVAGEEEARRRIARELHDDYCQRLAAIAFELKVVRRGLVGEGAGKVGMEGVSASLTELGEDLRRLSHDLHPAVLERRGLAEALLDQGEEVERQYGLPVRLVVESPGETLSALTPAIELGLYRIVQEALANVVRHSQASGAEVTLSAGAGQIRLAVSDDGIGFRTDSERPSGGLGLASIEERVRLLGGRVRLHSAPGAGTHLEVAISLPGTGLLAQIGEATRRHRGLVAATLLVLLGLAAGLAAAVSQARFARLEAARAEAAEAFLESLFALSAPRQVRGEPPSGREILRQGTERLRHELADQPILRARLLNTLGGIHTNFGLYDEARPLLREALDLRERQPGSGDLELAETLGRLGALAHRSGVGDPIPFFERALALRERRQGSSVPEVAAALNELGTALAAKGRFDEAEATLERAAAVQERLWGDRDPRLAKTLHNLAGIAFYRDRLDDAERYLQRALAIREAVLPADDLELAGSYEALALLLNKQGRAAEAVALLEPVVARVEQAYGPDHPDTARAVLNLGIARSRLGEDAAAVGLFERALASSERALAPDHSLVVRALASLASQHFLMGRYPQAEPRFRRLLALHERGVNYEAWDEVLAQWAQLRSATRR